MGFQFQVYTKAADGFGSGSYSNHHLKGASVKLERSLFEGDKMTIVSTRKDVDPEIHKIRPVRLYKDGTKLFDGLIKAPEYNRRYSRLQDLTAAAYGWERELAAIDISSLTFYDVASYPDKTINEIFTGLVMLANAGGLTKKATYKYDTSKIPNYENVSAAFETVITKMYSGSILSAMYDLTKELDIAETTYAWEWAIKVDALQSDNYIYVIPQMIRATDIDASASFQDAKLRLPKAIWRDYSRLTNFVDVRGKGALRSLTYSTAWTLPETNIPTNTEEFDAVAQPSARHYLTVMIWNPTAGDKTGSVKINGSDGAGNELSERFFLSAPAEAWASHVTDNRYATLATGALSSFEVDSFSGCTIRVREALNGIAGRSVNQYALRKKVIPNLSFDTQEKVDAYSNQLVRLYHAPTVWVEARVKENYAVFSDLTGKRIDLFNDFSGALEGFACIKQEFYFIGTRINQKVTGMTYNIDWEYTE